MWNSFIYFASAAIAFWLLGILFSYKQKRTTASTLIYTIGTLTIGLFIVTLWL